MFATVGTSDTPANIRVMDKPIELVRRQKIADALGPFLQANSNSSLLEQDGPDGEKTTIIERPWGDKSV